MRNIYKNIIFGDPKNCIMFIYIAPSNDHSLLTLNLHFEVIVKRFEVVFWCLEWECYTFQNTDENSLKSTNTIMALKCIQSWLVKKVEFMWCYIYNVYQMKEEYAIILELWNLIFLVIMCILYFLYCRFLVLYILIKEDTQKYTVPYFIIYNIMVHSFCK